MRLKKSLINVIIGMLAYLASFLPLFMVRKSFIEVLGAQLMGLTSLYTNIISYLSVVEMGIGIAIIYSLYKPFSEKNEEEIKGYLSYYKKIYQIIGCIIFTIGLLITPFLHFFIKDSLDINIIRMGFILFLVNSALGYMFTYKHCLLNVAQENYKVTLSLAISKILIAILQVIVIKEYRSFFGYIYVQIIINLLFYIILNVYINSKFKWLKRVNGEIGKEEKGKLKKNIKALFCHKIGAILVLATDNIVVSAFINLKTVAAYNNYTLITTAFTGLVSQAMSGLTASIGNLLIEKNKKYSYEIHKKLFFINFWVASFIVITLFNTISHFIGLWLGKEYILDKLTIGLILFNLYFLMMRGQVEQFKTAAGEFYKDRYAPICEGIINITMSIIFVKWIGLPGVFLGTIISNLTVVFWTQPKIVYKYVFDEPLKNYVKRYFKYLMIGVITLIITIFLTSSLKDMFTIKAFILNCLINIVVINIVYLIIFWKNENFIYFKEIALKIFKRKKVNLN